MIYSRSEENRKSHYYLHLILVLLFKISIIWGCSKKYLRVYVINREEWCRHITANYNHPNHKQQINFANVFQLVIVATYKRPTPCTNVELTTYDLKLVQIFIIKCHKEFWQGFIMTARIFMQTYRLLHLLIFAQVHNKQQANGNQAYLKISMAGNLLLADILKYHLTMWLIA